MKTKTRLVYSDLHLTGTYTTYGDDACTTAIAVNAWTGVTVAGDVLTSGARKIDVHFSTYKATPLNDGSAGYDNQNTYCGSTDWAANVEKDVLGKACYGFSVPADGVNLDIYKVDGTSLTFGKGSTIKAPAVESDRPTELDPTRVFTRQ